MSNFIDSLTTPASVDQRKHLRQLVLTKATQQNKDIRIVWKELHSYVGKNKVEKYSTRNYNQALKFFK